MRNPERIDDMLATIKEIWQKYPDLRLGQLVTNVIDEDLIYYIEDDELKKRLVTYYLCSQSKKLDK